MSVATVKSDDIHKLTICNSDNDLMQAADLMVAQNVNALAVTNSEGNLVGILTDHDVMKALVEHEGRLSEHEVSVSEVMTPRVITCTSKTNLSRALKLMGYHRIRHLVVVNDNRPVSVLSIKDILEKVHQNEDLEIKVLRDIAAASLAKVSAEPLRNGTP